MKLIDSATVAWYVWHNSAVVTILKLKYGGSFVLMRKLPEKFTRSPLPSKINPRRNPVNIFGTNPVWERTPGEITTRIPGAIHEKILKKILKKSVKEFQDEFLRASREKSQKKSGEESKQFSIKDSWRIYWQKSQKDALKESPDGIISEIPTGNPWRINKELTGEISVGIPKWDIMYES